MADQKRWFKVWTSLLVDMDALPNEVIGAWTRLGCRAALVGSEGVVGFADWAHLARFWNVTVDDAQRLAHVLPNVRVTARDSCNERERYMVTLTFGNWQRYQVDDSRLRVRAFRAKVKRSKKRGDKKRTEESSPLSPHGGPPDDLSITRPAGRPEGPARVAGTVARLLATLAENGIPEPTGGDPPP